MKFSKPMIDLVYAIRRLSPSERKPAIKLANPELFDELRHCYFQSTNTICKALIKELFSLAGSEWEDLLASPNVEMQKQTVKVYRGQTIFEARGAGKNRSSADIKKRMYRGQAVEA